MPTQAPDGKTVNTEPARRAFRQRFEDQVDPERKLDPAERERLAEEARRAYYTDLGRKSGKARRDRSEQVAELLHRTRTKRGMQLVIDDPAIIARVAAIVAAGGDAA